MAADTSQTMTDDEAERLWAMAPARLRVLVDRIRAAEIRAARAQGMREAAAAIYNGYNFHSRFSGFAGPYVILARELAMVEQRATAIERGERHG